MATVNSTAVTSFVAKSIFEWNIALNPLINTANRNFVAQFQPDGYAPGKTIDIKVPGYPNVTTGLTATPEAIEDLTLPYVITEDDLYNVVKEVTNFDMKFDFVGGVGSLTGTQKQAIVDNYAYPAYLALCQRQETVASYRMKTNALYTPIDEVGKLAGLNNFASVSQVSEFMDNMQLNTASRTFMMNLKDANSVANSLQNSFNVSLNQKISDNAFIGGSASKGMLAGLDVMRSTNLRKHTSGPLAGVSGITVASVGVDGTTVTLTGVTAVTTKLINAGDMISIPDVFLVSPIDKVKFGAKLVITALEDANGDGAGNVTIKLPYPLLASGTHANVASLPVATNRVDVYPSHNLNFAYVPAGLSVVPLELGDIKGADNSKSEGMNACPIKTVIQGSVNSFANVFRISQLLGIRAFTPYVIAVPSI